MRRSLGAWEEWNERGLAEPGPSLGLAKAPGSEELSGAREELG